TTSSPCRIPTRCGPTASGPRIPASSARPLLPAALRASPLASIGGARHISPVMPASPAIDVERLVKIYKNVRAVDAVSFSIARGSITGLLGGNGAGKTTTIAMIMGLTTPTSGRVTVLGAEMPRQRYRVLQRMNFESPY